MARTNTNVPTSFDTEAPSVLSMDVGFRCLGWTIFQKGQIKACGTIISNKVNSTNVAEDYAERAQSIAIKLKDIITDYNVQGLVGELPSGGAQSYKAGAMMVASISLVNVISALLSIPAKWVSPREVKLALSGKANATKEEMMAQAKLKFKYAVPIFPTAKGHFEHVADAIGAYMAARNSNVVKMFG